MTPEDVELLRRTSDTRLSKIQAQQVSAAIIESTIPYVLKLEQVETLIERAKPALTSAQLVVFRKAVTKYDYVKWEGPVTVIEREKSMVTLTLLF